ncbi:MAG: hypothetical protein R3C24_15675 [Cyanobacteriota/Melainabacteria group bacterium]
MQYSKPVSAPEEKGLILGHRFSRLLESIMRFRGYENFTVAAPEESRILLPSYDYVIETKVFLV